MGCFPYQLVNPGFLPSTVSSKTWFCQVQHPRVSSFSADAAVRKSPSRALDALTGDKGKLGRWLDVFGWWIHGYILKYTVVIDLPQRIMYIYICIWYNMYIWYIYMYDIILYHIDYMVICLNFGFPPSVLKLKMYILLKIRGLSHGSCLFTRGYCIPFLCGLGFSAFGSHWWSET